MTGCMTIERLEPRLPKDAGAGSVGTELGDVMPDFHLMDINGNSLRYQQSVSPRDYLQQVSGWYFGHAT